MSISLVRSRSEVRFDRVVPIHNWYYPVRTAPLAVGSFDDIGSALTALRPEIGSRALYFHVPFCETICSFCPFVRTTFSDRSFIDAYVAALLKEVEIKSSIGYFSDVQIGSIFVGGGTPSLLDVPQIRRIGARIHEVFDLSRLQEFSFEMEAKSVTAEKLDALRSIGVTHVRLGLQTFNQKYRDLFDLTASMDDVHRSISLMKRYFENVSVDILYAMAGQTIDEFHGDIESATELDVKLIEFFPVNNLSTQPKLHDRFDQMGLRPPSARMKYDMNVLLDGEMRRLGYVPHNGHGYVRKPVSGPGCEAPDEDAVVADFYSFKYHEYVYGYSDVDLIGFGTNAISSTSDLRLQNVASRTKYVSALLDHGDLPVCAGLAHPSKKHSKPVALRLPYHGDVRKDRVNWGQVQGDVIERLLELQDAELITEDEDKYKLTKNGWYWYGNIMYYLSPQDERDGIDEMIRTQLSQPSRRLTREEIWFE